MKLFREWRQIQIWSSATTRKIGKFVVLTCMAVFIWKFWLNPMERKASRAMLVEARKIRTASAEDFQKESAEGENLKVKAEKVAWTFRDNNLEMAASATLFLAQSCREVAIKLPGRFDPAPCNKDYESLDSIVRNRVDLDHGFVGF